MADRNFNRKQALEKEVKEIYAKVTIAASGAPTLVSASSLGVASIGRSSAGLYVLTLQDKYSSLKHAHIQIVTPTAEEMQANLVSESVASAKTVTFRCTTAGVATDPASGDSFLIALQLKNTTVR
jgi:hypothetical protein